MSNSVLTPLQLTAGASLLSGSGIGLSGTLILAIGAYSGSNVISPLLSAVTSAPAANVTANTVNAMTSAGSSSVPALNDSLPIAYSSLGSQMTKTVLDQAVLDSCGNNVSKLCQAIAISNGYASQTNVFINSAVNGQTYLNNSFTSMSDTITGDITQVTSDTTAFAQDLAALGNAIDLSNLNELGSPATLVRQIYKATGTGLSSVSVALSDAGVPVDTVLNLTNPTFVVTDSIQKLMYEAMQKITGTTLQQCLKLLGVTTPNISNLADLLNPVKMFPNSYKSFTVPTVRGSTPIYVGDSAGVNQTLIDLLPPYVVSSLV